MPMSFPANLKQSVLKIPRSVPYLVLALGVCLLSPAIAHADEHGGGGGRGGGGGGHGGGGGFHGGGGGHGDGGGGFHGGGGGPHGGGFRGDGGFRGGWGHGGGWRGGDWDRGWGGGGWGGGSYGGFYPGYGLGLGFDDPGWDDDEFQVYGPQIVYAPPPVAYAPPVPYYGPAPAYGYGTAQSVPEPQAYAAIAPSSGPITTDNSRGFYTWPVGVQSGSCNRVGLGQIATSLTGVSAVNLQPGTQLGGIAVGPVIGGKIAPRLDVIDQACAMESLERTQTGTVVSWQTSTGIPITLQITRSYNLQDGTSCRDYTATARFGSHPETVRDTACRSSRTGSWQAIR